MQRAFNVTRVDFQGFRHLEMEPRPPWPDSGGDPFHSPGDGESMSARPYQVELLEKGPDSLSSSWILGAMHNEWRRIKGIVVDYPDENNGQLQSSMSEWEESIKKYKDSGI